MKLRGASAPWKESYDQPRQLIKSRDITLPTKHHLVKAMFFLAVMYRCESWTIKKSEHQRIDAFELWCWIRHLRVPWTARRSSQSILKKSVLNIHWRTDAEAEAPTLWPPDAKNWLIGHLMWRSDSFEKTLMLGKMKVGGEEDDRGWDAWMASPTQWTWVWVNSRS